MTDLGAPFPTPAEAMAATRRAAERGASALRDAVRYAITNSDREVIHVEIPAGTGDLACEMVSSELEERGWEVRRESSPRNESYMVISAREGY